MTKSLDPYAIAVRRRPKAGKYSRFAPMSEPWATATFDSAVPTEAHEVG